MEFSYLCFTSVFSIILLWFDLEDLDFCPIFFFNSFPSFLLSSPGIMLLIFTKASGHVPLKILSIEDGTVLKSFNHLLHRNKKVDFIEQFNEKLLVKQENENLQILDVSFSRLLCNVFYLRLSSNLIAVEYRYAISS